MAKHITVRGAQPNSKDEEPISSYITITDYFPYATGRAHLEELGRGFKEDAETLFQALYSSLPGGTLDQLLVLMLQEKASHFIVSHRLPAEYQKMEAASEMFDALKKGDMLSNEGPFLLEYASNLIHHFAPNTAQELRDKAKIERRALAKARGESEAQDDKHTPGPWKIAASMRNHQTVVYKPEGDKDKYDPQLHTIAYTTVRDQRSMEEAEANARLIACSPSMLALLEELLPAIQAEAWQRENALAHKGESDDNIYWTEMGEFVKKISAEIDRAKGKGASDG